MAIHIEFYGVARLRAELAQVEIEDGGDVLTLQEVLVRLASQVPAFANACMQNGELRREYAINCDGQKFVKAPDSPIAKGSTLLILSADAGG